MLSPLLAVLLSAASDSAVANDSIAQRAADSAALERISPLPPSSGSPSSSKAPRRQKAHLPPEWADSEGPLDQGSVGIGFRALGEVPRLHLQVAVSSSNFIRLRGAFLQRSETESRALTETQVYTNGTVGTTAYKTLEVEAASTDWEVQLAMGGLGLCQGNLCGSWSAGPFLGRSISTTENAEVQTPYYEFRERHIEKRLGVAGSLGLVWKFREGLALSADVGATMAKFSGKRSLVSRNTSSNPATSFKSGSEPEGSELAVNFLGVGLDAWF